MPLQGTQDEQIHERPEERHEPEKREGEKRHACPRSETEVSFVGPPSPPDLEKRERPEERGKCHDEPPEAFVSSGPRRMMPERSHEPLKSLAGCEEDVEAQEGREEQSRNERQRPHPKRGVPRGQTKMSEVVRHWCRN